MGSHTIPYTDAEALAAAEAGAVSTATADKLVVRDAEGQAAFAAPAAAGDALIKGTPITSGEYPAVTDEYYLVGTGASMEERAVPTAGITSTTGTFTGNNGVNRAIPHGLGKTPSIVFVFEETLGTDPDEVGWVQGSFNHTFDGGCRVVTAINSTNFYVGGDSTAHLNELNKPFRWLAIG